MSNPSPISYRYNELENWPIESNAMADSCRVRRKESSLMILFVPGKFATT